MDFLRLLESLRTPFFDAFFSAITHLGDETVFMVLGLLIFWCLDKKWGYRYFLIGLTGNSLNQLLKAIFLIPRPWVLDSEFTIVESARKAATGYSFPSGHTQSVTNAFGAVAVWLKKNIATVSCIVIIAATAFSRMYLGVHTPMDVGVSLVTGTVIVLVFGYLFKKSESKPFIEWILWGIACALCIALVLFVFLRAPGERNIAEFDASGKKAACTFTATMLGFLLTHIVEDKYIKFEVKGVWWAQLLKLILGLGLILGIKSCLKPVFKALFGESILFDGLRYFLIAVTAGILWPLTFKFWSRLGKKKGSPQAAQTIK